MTRFTGALLVLLTMTPGIAATAQLGEMQFGVIGSYGGRDPFREGVGLAFGVAPGRLAYVGLRFTYHAGATTDTLPGSATAVTNRALVLVADLGVQFPIGRLEVRPGISLGLTRFTQLARTTSGAVSRHSNEFLAAPGIALQLGGSRFAVMPEVQYYITGQTELPRPVQKWGLVTSVRVVFLREIKRIRR